MVLQKKTFSRFTTYFQQELTDYEIAYTTCGNLNANKDNVILVCHALTGNAYITGIDPDAEFKKPTPGWWSYYVGAGKAIDTNKFFVVCTNVIGGCHGSTGPSSINPKTEKPYAMSFPLITVQDMVATQKKLIDALGIEKLFAVIGGSMGGMQTLVWPLYYPHIVKNAILIATSMAHSAMQIGFNEIGRQAIINDPSWNQGNYYSSKRRPDLGLAIARMIGHITYLSEYQLHEKFGRKQQNTSKSIQKEFRIAGYLQYQSQRFIQRFDPNSYLYLTKAVDLFDLPKDIRRPKALSLTDTNYLILSFASDWLYTPKQSQVIVKFLKRSRNRVSYVNLETSYGHDSFLIDNPEFQSVLKSYLEKAAG